jgi:GT2 family glycosyltransferase
MAGGHLTNLVIAGGNAEALGTCLNSIDKSTYPSQATLVVDNSRSGIADEFKNRFAGVEFLRGVEPRTFAHAVNAGLERAFPGGAEFVFLLNDDVEVEAGTAGALAAAARRLGPGVFAPEVWPADGSQRRRYRFDWGKRLLTSGPAESGGGEPFEIDYAEGSAVLVCAEVFSAVGGFDEWFGFYYEDADFSLRARAADFPVVEVPGARVSHVVGASAGRGLSAFKAYWRARNALRFARKHHALSRPLVNAAYHFGGFIIPEALRAIGGAVTRESEADRRLSALWRGTIDGFTGRQRPPG